MGVRAEASSSRQVELGAGEDFPDGGVRVGSCGVAWASGGGRASERAASGRLRRAVEETAGAAAPPGLRGADSGGASGGRCGSRADGSRGVRS